MMRAPVSLGIVALLGMTGIATAQQAFDTPDRAAGALVQALRSDDMKAVSGILGPQGERIISSGDPVADARTRKDFIAAYDDKHRIDEKANEAILSVGTQDYPVPIPLVRKRGKWEFDTGAALDEILFRRIGRNELQAIQSCLAYVDAQNEYADKDRTGAGANVYAERIVSSPGKKDGLFWPASEGAEQSPLGPLMARATGRGYRIGAGQSPYEGYYFKVLTKQGPAAPGGALDYVVDGKMIGGFALVAYPAEYRNSGVMTFIVSHAGVVYQKDLGPDTASVAKRMTAFNPGSGWQPVGKTASGG